jgi:hypothetical protein
MSGYVEWIAAVAEGSDAENALKMAELAGVEAEEDSSESDLLQSLPAHDFKARPPTFNGDLAESALDRNPDIWMYRKRTMALLRRYMRLSMQTGRLPSVIGRELFRAKVTAYTATTFEERVIFVHDIERCLERLPPSDQKIVARIVLQEYDHVSAARILQCARKTIERRLPEILDDLSEEFLRLRLLVTLPEAKKRTE